MSKERFLRQLTTRVLPAVVLWCVWNVVPAFAVTRYAVVVAVSNFDDSRVPRLDYVKYDAKRTFRTLNNLGFNVYVCCEDSAGIANSIEPTRENVLKILTEVLPKKVSPGDVVLIYFSTHGTAVDEKTYLATKDSKLVASSVNDKWELDTSTALAAGELRKKVGELRTNNVLLAFDACEAAGTRASDYRSVQHRWLAEDDSTIATLASCATNQKSCAIMAETGRWISHFTYWLNSGMNGAADRNGDGVVATDELAQYVQDNVTYVNDLLFARDKSRKQTPYVVASEKSEPFALTKVAPRERSKILDETADQIATCLLAAALKNKERRENLFVDVDVQMKNFQTERERDAASAFGDAFGERLKECVRAKLKDVAVAVEFDEEVPAQKGMGKVYIEVDATDRNAYDVSGRLVNLTEADGSQARDYEFGAKVAYDSDVEARLDGDADGTFVGVADVRLKVVKPDGSVETRRPENINGALWFELNPDEKYKIVYKLAWTRENSPILQNGVGVRAIVDGRNTLAQYASFVKPKSLLSFSCFNETDEDVAETIDVEFVERDEPVERAQTLTTLDEARFWYVKKPGTYEIAGYYEPDGNGIAGDTNATCSPFAVVKNDGTAEQGDEIGRILLAFYPLMKTRSGEPADVRTVPSAAQPVTLTYVSGYKIPEGQKPFVCFSCRYASSKALAELRRDPDAFYAKAEKISDDEKDQEQSEDSEF